MEQTNNSEKLYAFVEAAKAKGVPDDALAGILREQAWPTKHVYAAIGRY